MLSSIWNWLKPDNLLKEERAKNLLLRRCLMRRYQKQRQSIVTIQHHAREYLKKQDSEDDVFTIFTRNLMKRKDKLLM